MLPVCVLTIYLINNFIDLQILKFVEHKNNEIIYFFFIRSEIIFTFASAKAAW